MNRNPRSTIPARAHRYTTRVYYEDTDAGGVVYHAKYLGMAERARTEALRDLGASHAELIAHHGLTLVVRRVIIDYLAPALLDDSLLIVTWPVSVGGASIDLRQTFFRADQELAMASVMLVCVRRDETGGLSAARIPDRWRVALTSLAAGEG